MEKVFVYGTLRVSEIRNKLLSRQVPSKGADKITGYKLSTVYGDGQSYPIIIEDKTSALEIDGEIIEVSENELTILDDYEGDLYIRKKIGLRSGDTAWAYTK